MDLDLLILRCDSAPLDVHSGTSWRVLVLATGPAPCALFILHVAQMLYYLLTCNMNIHFALCGRIGWGKDLGYRCFPRLPQGQAGEYEADVDVDVVLLPEFAS